MVSWKTLYQKAHEEDFKSKYPSTFSDGHYAPPVYPDPRKTNGLTNIIANYITWTGNYANRINVSGRLVGGLVKTEAGNLFDDRKWIKSSTKKGSADLMCSINGRMVSIEVKNAATKDAIRDAQVKEKTRVEKSGGYYIVIRTVEEFFEWYPSFSTKQLSLL